MNRLFVILGIASILIVAAIVVVGGIIAERLLQPQGVVTITSTPASTTATSTATTTTIDIPENMPHVEGAQIVDASGRPLLLRGSQIQSSL